MGDHRLIRPVTAPGLVEADRPSTRRGLDLTVGYTRIPAPPDLTNADDKTFR